MKSASYENFHSLLEKLKDILEDNEFVSRRVMSAAYYALLFFAYEYFGENTEETSASYLYNIAINRLPRRNERFVRYLHENRIAADHYVGSSVDSSNFRGILNHSGRIISVNKNEAEESLKKAEELGNAFMEI